MSRSFKHVGGYKDSSKFGKKYANKKYRRRPIELTNIPLKKYTDGYNICDWSMLVIHGYNWFDPMYKAFMK